MKTIHGLLLLVILALLGMLGLLRPVEGFKDGGEGPSGPITLTPPPTLRAPPPNNFDPVAFAKGAAAGGGQSPSGPITLMPPTPNSFTPDYKGMALSSLESMKQACNSMASVETYIKQEAVLPTQMAPTQMPTPPPTAKRSVKPTPALNQGKITQLNRPMAQLPAKK